MWRRLESDSLLLLAPRRIGTVWRDLGVALARSIDGLSGRWLIAVDEVPVFLLNLLKPQDGLARVRGFLYWLRDLRQDHHAKVRWILAGSIGLDTVAARHGLGDTVNDLVPMPLGAFEPETAQRFLQALATSYDLDMTAEVSTYITERLGWPVPYYLQILFGAFYDPVEDGATLGTDVVDQVLDDLMKPVHKGRFKYN